MNCYNCGEVVKNTDAFCTKCGSNLKQRQCEKCGCNVEINYKYCGKCGAEIETINNENTENHRKKTFISSENIIGILIVLVFCCLALVYVESQSGFLKSHKLIGVWSTEDGMDSVYLTFREDGTMKRHGPFIMSHTHEYDVEGDILSIDDEEYTYSSKAKKIILLPHIGI